MNSIAVGASVWWWRNIGSKRSKSVSTVVVSNLLHKIAWTLDADFARDWPMVADMVLVVE
jgi:hypothetical protein